MECVFLSHRVSYLLILLMWQVSRYFFAALNEMLFLCSFGIPLVIYVKKLILFYKERMLLKDPLRRRVCKSVCLYVCMYVCNILTSLPSPPLSSPRWSSLFLFNICFICNIFQDLSIFKISFKIKLFSESERYAEPMKEVKPATVIPDWLQVVFIWTNERR